MKIYAKRLLASILVCALVVVAPAADGPKHFPENARKLVDRGIKNETELKTFLLTLPKWTWEHRAAENEAIKFESNGVATQTFWTGKWVATGARKVIIRVPNGGTSVLIFSDDLYSYRGVFNNNTPFTGTFTTK